MDDISGGERKAVFVRKLKSPGISFKHLCLRWNLLLETSATICPMLCWLPQGNTFVVTYQRHSPPEGILLQPTSSHPSDSSGSQGSKARRGQGCECWHSGAGIKWWQETGSGTRDLTSAREAACATHSERWARNRQETWTVTDHFWRPFKLVFPILPFVLTSVEQ